MHFVRGRRREPARLGIPLLLAAGSLGLLGLLWRRMAAPRTDRNRRGARSNLTIADAPPSAALTAAVAAPDTQLAPAGSGPLVHREYDILVTGSTLSAPALLRLMQRHLSELSPSALAHFEKSHGLEGLARVGDEYDITMLGPWNGRVRVIESTTRHFTLVTLEGHPEAGHITFTVAQASDSDDTLQVLIESWARARDAIVAVAYGTLGVGKQMQAEVWITFLQRLSALAGVERTPEVRIRTERLAPSDAPMGPARDA